MLPQPGVGSSARLLVFARVVACQGLRDVCSCAKELPEPVETGATTWQEPLAVEGGLPFHFLQMAWEEAAMARCTQDALS